jgi:N-methylhydantoinase A
MVNSSRIAVDVGGTFTDVVDLNAKTGKLSFGKVSTTPAEPTVGVMNGFGAAASDIADIDTFSHGTTLGLNALLTRTGASVAVVSTKGFRDVYLLGRTDRRTNFDIKYRKASALVQRYDTFEVNERCLFDGSVHTAFDLESAREVARTIAQRGYDSVAVGFLHSYVNPDHELRMREVLAEEAPGVAVTLSHELSREYREYERTSTAVLDAYIKPIVRDYLRKLEGELAAAHFTGRFLMTRSGGGAMTARTAREQPVSLILSGPAGGVIGAAYLANVIGQPNMITIDMGGTSLDASLIVDGEPVLYLGAEFEQLPINTPSLYIHTIGAGGGSIVWLDGAGALQVGPQSAGAVPGPASYGTGGESPTFTDAALVLGYLGTETPLAGALTLDTALAVRALEPVAQAMNMSIPALARGIIRISSTKIMGAARAITVEVGRDPKDFALLAFGGGGGLVAVDVAVELGIPKVVIPPGQGAFSAFGMLMADVQHDFARTIAVGLDEVTPGQVDATYLEMEREAEKTLAAEGIAAERRTMTRTLDVRYKGQEHTVTLNFPAELSAMHAEVAASFTELHERQYGHAMDDPVEVTILRLRATGILEKPELPLLEARSEGAPSPHGTRLVYVSADRPAVEYSLYIREQLLANDEISGPAVVAEHTATTVIHDGDHLVVGAHGELVISIGDRTDGVAK